MAVKLRLTRVGKRGQAKYRLVAIDEHKKRDGRAIEILGHYDPSLKVNHIEAKVDRVKYWLSVGAQPSHTVSNLLKKQGHAEFISASPEIPKQVRDDKKKK